MKKLILKTACITLGAMIIVLVAVFGLMSLWAPAAMMRFTASLGLDAISGDYAYQEYERSGNLEYLARSFIVSAHAGSDTKATKRFDLLYGNEKFGEFCAEHEDVKLTEEDSMSYRSYLCAQGARVKYRTASSDTEKQVVCDFAIAETETSFPVGNPVVALATEAISKEDGAFCETLLSSFSKSNKWNDEQTDYRYIIKFLSDLTGGMKDE